jgi:hypothetical protein
MSKPGAKVAQEVPGFRPNPRIADYSFKAVRTLKPMRAVIVATAQEIAEDVEALTGAMLDSTCIDKVDNPGGQVFEAWQFALKLVTPNGEVKIEVGEDALSVKAMEGVVKELDKQGVLREQNVTISDVKQLDDSTIAVTINLLKAA